MGNHCKHATITNHFSQAIYDKPSPHSTHDKLPTTNHFALICHPRKTLSPHYTHKKNTLDPWQTILAILPWQITSPMLLMTISHVPFLITMSPIPPGQNIPPMLPITNHFTHQIHDIAFISKQKRYFTRLMFLCRGVTFPGLSFFGNSWDYVAIDSLVIRL